MNCMYCTNLNTSTKTHTHTHSERRVHSHRRKWKSESDAIMRVCAYHTQHNNVHRKYYWKITHNVIRICLKQNCTYRTHRVHRAVIVFSRHAEMPTVATKHRRIPTPAAATTTRTAAAAVCLNITMMKHMSKPRHSRPRKQPNRTYDCKAHVACSKRHTCRYIRFEAIRYSFITTTHTCIKRHINGKNLISLSASVCRILQMQVSTCNNSKKKIYIFLYVSKIKRHMQCSFCCCCFFLSMWPWNFSLISM